MYEKTFQTHILPLKDKLYRLALRITEHAAEAEDIVQDAMLRAWERRSEWGEIGSIEAWTLTICRNMAIDRTRLKSSQLVEIDNEEDTLQQGEDTEGKYNAAEGIDLVKQLVEQLPPKQKEIFQLRDIEGMTYKEIEQILNLSEEQVKVYLFRARQYIKKHFEKINKYGLHLH